MSGTRSGLNGSELKILIPTAARDGPGAASTTIRKPLPATERKVGRGSVLSGARTAPLAAAIPRNVISGPAPKTRFPARLRDSSKAGRSAAVSRPSSLTSAPKQLTRRPPSASSTAGPSPSCNSRARWRTSSASLSPSQLASPGIEGSAWASAPTATKKIPANNAEIRIGLASELNNNSTPFKPRAYYVPTGETRQRTGLVSPTPNASPKGLPRLLHPFSDGTNTKSNPPLVHPSTSNDGAILRIAASCEATALVHCGPLPRLDDQHPICRAPDPSLPLIHGFAKSSSDHERPP